MASFTFSSERFPVGTVIGAYVRTARADGRAPIGTAVSSGTVASNGTVVIASLSPATAYAAYALVGGDHRYVNFDTGGSTHTVLRHASGEPTSSLGSEGEFYLDEDGSGVYGPKDGDDWPLALPGADRLGSAQNPVTDADADRPEGMTVVWWKTEEIPTNAIAGDLRIAI